jgi:capsular polysaccharide biosynthesis protein
MTVEREINLASVYHVVWERGKRILLVTFLLMGLSYVTTLFMTERYEAHAELEVKPSRIGENVMRGWITPFEVYGRYIGDETLLNIMNDLGLRGEPFNIRKVDQFAARITVSRFRETSVLFVYTEMETPEMAARVANTLADHIIKKNLDLLAKEAHTSVNLIDQSLSARITDNASREVAYQEAQERYRIEIQQKYLDNLISRWQTRMSERENLIMSTRELATRLASLEEAVSHQPQKLELKRTLSEDLVLLEAIREAAPDQKGPDLANLSLIIESPNQEHYTLLSLKDQMRAQLEGDLAKLALTETLIPDLKREIDQVQGQIYMGQLEVARMKAEYDRSYEIFGGIDKEYGWTPITIFSERYDINIISPAVPKDKVVTPNRPAIVVLSGSLAFLIALAYFLLRDLYGLAQRRDIAGGYGSSA